VGNAVAGAKAQPVGAGLEAEIAVGLTAIHLGHEHQQPAGCSLDVSGQRRDLVGQFNIGFRGQIWRARAANRSGHPGPFCL
jgi:hypothetical protein